MLNEVKHLLTNMQNYKIDPSFLRMTICCNYSKTPPSGGWGLLQHIQHPEHFFLDATA